MTLCRAQAIHHAVSGITSDDMVNTFYMRSVIGGLPSDFAIDQQNVDAIGTAIGRFFKTDVAGDVFSVNTFRCLDLLHPTLQLSVKCYDMADPSPREPKGVYDEPFMGATTNHGPLPQEVALCLSYRGVNPSLPPGRRRGRIYIGPLSFQGIQTAPTDPNPGRPLGTFTNTLRLAAVRLHTELLAAGWQWVVYSPTASGVGAPVITPITEVSTDDAWDTQRRRGPDPTRRDVVPF